MFVLLGDADADVVVADVVPEIMNPGRFTLTDVVVTLWAVDDTLWSAIITVADTPSPPLVPAGIPITSPITSNHTYIPITFLHASRPLHRSMTCTFFPIVPFVLFAACLAFLFSTPTSVSATPF